MMGNLQNFVNYMSVSGIEMNSKDVSCKEVDWTHRAHDKINLQDIANTVNEFSRFTKGLQFSEHRNVGHVDN
jgi:hypothetical protein